MQQPHRWLGLICTLLTLAGSVRADWKVPLTIEDRGGKGQDAAFVFSGVPFKLGQVRDLRLSLQGNKGEYLRVAADEVLAGRGARDTYAPLFQGRAMVMAHALDPQEKYERYVQQRLDEMFTRKALEPVSLAGGMKDGPWRLD